MSATDDADIAADDPSAEEILRRLDYLASTPIEDWPLWLHTAAADVLGRRHKRLSNINPEDGGVGAADDSLPRDIYDDTHVLSVAAAIYRGDVLQGYANHIEATYLEEVEEGKALMSFGSLYPRHMNISDSP